MAVHVPLSPEAQAEAKYLMLASNNLLKPQDGKAVTVPSQDMILGSYYLTVEYDDEPGVGKVFKDEQEAFMAYDAKVVGLHAPIKLRVYKEIDGKMQSAIIDTTIGRIIFNDIIPQTLGYVDRTKPENAFRQEIEFPVRKKEIGQIIDMCIEKFGIPRTAVMLDDIKRLGYKYSTVSGITVSVSDMEVPESRARILKEADEAVDVVYKNYKRGLISDEQRYNEVIKVWTKATDDIQDAILANNNIKNPIYIMAHTGARGNPKQIRQLSGIRGLMADTSGKAVEIPIRSSFRDGLDVLEYFISSHGARKGLADTALRTADSGYLTRRLVDVNQEVIITADDCGTHEGLEVEAIMESGEPIEKLFERIEGRYLADDVKDSDGNVMYERNTYITTDIANKIVKAGIEKVKIRSALTCDMGRGVCARCYGKNLATGEPISVGEAVGIIAAQSIGEPGTQLTMRTIHSGGVAGSDITQGLPRVEELFEARRPKGVAIVSEIGGTVKITAVDELNREVTVTSEDKTAQTYKIYGARPAVKDGDVIKAGDKLTEGSLDPHDIIRINGVTAVQNYLIQEVQRVYRTQGVHINDKHIELVAKQMLRKVKVDDRGDTELIAGSMIDINEFKEANKLARESGKKEATGTRELLGITKVALLTESFLSAASFQETARVLTDAAVKGKEDKLLGLKENVIIGRLIPAGTGLIDYANLKVKNINEKPLEDEEATDVEDYIE